MYWILEFILLNFTENILLFLQKSDYYQEAIKNGLGPQSEIPCMFTSCGPARLKMGKYNVPVGLYSEETIMDLGSSGNHGFVP